MIKGLVLGLKCSSLSVMAIFAVTIIALVGFFNHDAYPITVSRDTSATDLANAITVEGGSGIIVTSATLSPQTLGNATWAGTYTNPTGTYGIGPGIVLSTGDVANYGDGSNTSDSTTISYGVVETTAQKALLDPITGNYIHYDVTELDITFDMMPGHDTVFFNVVFGSEEYPEFVGREYVDGFGLYVNGVNIAFVDDKPVNINHPYMIACPGTELNGVLDGLQKQCGSVVHTLSKNVGDGSKGNHLTFIVADTSDSKYDTTVYISQLGGSLPPPLTPTGSSLPVAVIVGGSIAAAAVGIFVILKLGIITSHHPPPKPTQPAHHASHPNYLPDLRIEIEGGLDE